MNTALVQYLGIGSTGGSRGYVSVTCSVLFQSLSMGGGGAGLSTGGRDETGTSAQGQG